MTLARYWSRRAFLRWSPTMRLHLISPTNEWQDTLVLKSVGEIDVTYYCNRTPVHIAIVVIELADGFKRAFPLKTPRQLVPGDHITFHFELT